MLTVFPLPAMTIVVYKMLKVVDLIALLDVQVKHVASEMILCAVEPNTLMHVIVFELKLDLVAVLLCLVLVPLLEILKCQPMNIGHIKEIKKKEKTQGKQIDKK